MDLRNMLPTKRFFTLPMIVLLLVVITGFITPHEYKKYTLFVLLVLGTIKIIGDLIKSRKEDKLNKTNDFWFSVLSVAVMIAIMTVLYFATRS